MSLCSLIFPSPMVSSDECLASMHFRTLCWLLQAQLFFSVPRDLIPLRVTELFFFLIPSWPHCSPFDTECWFSGQQLPFPLEQVLAAVSLLGCLTLRPTVKANSEGGSFHASKTPMPVLLLCFISLLPTLSKYVCYLPLANMPSGFTVHLYTTQLFGRGKRPQNRMAAIL